VSYATGRPNPTEHDYFFPGRPDHRAEVQVVRALAAVRPRYLLTMNRRLGFFFESPAYYFLLRRHVHQHYVLAARFGRYDVLRRRGLERAPATIVPEPYRTSPGAEALRRALSDPSRDLRRSATLDLLEQAGTPEGVGALVRSWGLDEPTLLLLVRTLGEAGDARAIRFLLDAFQASSKRLSDEAASALTLLAIRARTDRYLFTRGPRPRDRALWADPGVSRARLRDWLARQKTRRQVGLFAARSLALAGDREAIPVLEEVIRVERGLVREEYGAHLRIAAAEALVQLGRPEQLCTLVTHLALRIHEAQDTMPSVLIELVRRHPREGARCLAGGLASRAALAREMSAWVAGAVPLPAVAPELRAAAGDGDGAVRVAAVWALGRVRDGEARPVLARLAEDGDAELRAFAVEALGRIARRKASS
jgi:HEAT repeat protein